MPGVTMEPLTQVECAQLRNARVWNKLPNTEPTTVAAQKAHGFENGRPPSHPSACVFEVRKLY
jgi:hypothetical protein